MHFPPMRLSIENGAHLIQIKESVRPALRLSALSA